MAIDVRGIAPLLAVFDMPTSIKFYCEGLGFEVVSTDGKPAPQFDWVLLRLNGSELMLNTAYEEAERPPAPDPARIAAHQDVTGACGKMLDVRQLFIRRLGGDEWRVIAWNLAEAHDDIGRPSHCRKVREILRTCGRCRPECIRERVDWHHRMPSRICRTLAIPRP